VKDLLVHTDLPLTQIARLAGFDYVESMCRLFNNLAGRAPGDYRRESRIANHPERAATRVWTPPAVDAPIYAQRRPVVKQRRRV
jgi:AraC-like DNA-binding protein